MTRELFGTDGIRGKANRFPMTGEVAMHLGRALTRRLQGRHRPRIIIGKDTRRSCYLLESAIASGICSAGGDALLLGPMPTPAVAFLVRSMRADAGVMISASHNPYDDNGVKLFGPDGFKFSDEVELALEAEILQPPDESQWADGTAIGRTKRLDDALGRYVVFAKTAFPDGMTLDGVRVAVDCAHGAAYRVAPLALEELGAKVVPVGIAPNGININDGVGSLYPDHLANVVRENDCHIGICLDGDADRIIVVDENGVAVDGDQLMAMHAVRLIGEGRLHENTLVATVMSNLALDHCMADHGGRVLRTQVGDRYVVEAMRSGGYGLGGEQSGHVIFLSHGTTGDGLVCGLGVMGMMVREGRSVSELAKVLEPLPQVLVNVRVASKPPLDSLEQLQAQIRSVESELGTSGRVLVRYSGTERKARVMVEGLDIKRIQGLADELGATLVRATGG